MRKFIINVQFDERDEFIKLHPTFTDVREAIEKALDFVEDVNRVRFMLGINVKMTYNNWFISSSDGEIYVSYSPKYNGYLYTDYNNLECKTVFMF